MKALGFIGFRVDDRMIHGIVATQWVPNLKATRAMVIDDEASTNDIMRSSMKMATPAGVALSVIDHTKAVTNIGNNKYANQRVFCVFKTVEAAYELFKAGVEIPHLNLGDVTQNTGETTVLAKTVRVNPKEKEMLKEMRDAGVKITAQFTPSYDERFTSVLAHRAMIDGGVKKKERKENMFTPIQVILLCVLVGVWTWQKYNLQMFYYASVVTMGVLTGLIMGDVQTGMLVGGAMCLMSLGLFGAGGSSVPEYPVGCIAGAAFAIAMGITGQESVTTAMTIGVPVAALGAQLDVLGKTSGSFFINKMRECSEKKNWKSMGRWMWASQIPFIGLWVLPILLFTTVGSTYVQSVINAIPAWLNSGLNVASGMLPALGFAILLRQLPMKKYGYFILFGFVLSAYLNMSVLAIAMLAVVACAFIFQSKEAQRSNPVAQGATMTSVDMEDE